MPAKRRLGPTCAFSVGRSGIGWPVEQTLGCRCRPRAIGTAEQHRMDEQRVQLMQRDSLAPTVGEGSCIVVRCDDAVQMGKAEKRHHREIGLAVATMRGRVDQPHVAVGAPHDVA